VAYFVSRNILTGRKRQLLIEPEGEASMDAILVAFIILDKRRRDNQAPETASASG